MTQKIKFKGGIIATCMAVLIAMCMTVIISGCTSTELVDAPQSSGTKGQTITLNISCPEAAATTRADNDHVLRYSALLYEGERIDRSSFRERKEIVESSNTPENKITFEVEENIYTILIVGDYLPSNPIKISDNQYENCFYNIDYTNGRIYMYSVKNFPDEEPISLNCINNENYDCFAKSITVEKTAGTYERDVELERIVSRISFVNNTTTDSEIERITLDKFDFYYYCNLIGEPSVGSHAGSNDNYELPVLEIQPLSLKQNEELLFFYTLADNKEHREGIYEMKLTIEYKGDSPNKTTIIPSATIKPIANYKYKVMGAFLAEPEPQLGPIILNLSKKESWNEPDKEVKP